MIQLCGGSKIVKGTIVQIKESFNFFSFDLLRFTTVGQVRGDEGLMNDDKRWKFINQLVYKCVSERQILICQDGQSTNSVSIFSLQINAKFFFLLGIYAQLKQIAAQEIIRYDILNILIVWSWWSNHSIIFLFALFLPPKEKFNHPVECLRFDEEKADVLTVPFNNRWCIKQSYVVYLLCVYSHYFESFRLLPQIINSCQRLLYLIRIGEHLFDEYVIFLHVLFFNFLALNG